MNAFRKGKVTPIGRSGKLVQGRDGGKNVA